MGGGGGVKLLSCVMIEWQHIDLITLETSQ